jgi:large subunit ribosomal protein L4
MAEAKVIDALGKVVDSAKLDGRLFNSEAKPHLLHEYVVGYQRNQRQGNAATKTRTMVRGGGKKPWRQKGTGRARSGSNTSPVWVGGGIVWGPHPKNHYSRLPKKLKQAAMRSAFSDKAASGGLRIIDLPQFEKPRSRMVADFLKAQEIYHNRVLILIEAANDNFVKSCRNIKWLEVKRSVLVNPFDLVWAEFVLMTRDALRKIEEVFEK